MINKFLYGKGGAELYMYRLADLLEQRGAEIRYFGMRHPQNLPSETERFYVSQVDFENPVTLRERVRAAGRAIYSLEARSRLADLLAAGAPFDIAHLHNTYHQLSPSFLASLRTARVPVVMTVHDYKLVCPVYTLTSHGEMCERCVGRHFTNAVRRRCNRGSLSGSALVAGETWLHSRLHLWERGVDIFVTPSSYLRDRLIAGGYPPERVVAVHNFVDPDEFAPAEGPGDGFLYLGRLSHEKGVETLIEAAAGRDAAITIAGEGPERARLEAMAASSGARVEFTGHVSPDRVRELTAAARAIVVPSRWPENCPLVVLEAMASGRPVIASSVGGIPELVRDGSEGLLVPQGDAGALRAAIERLHGDAGFAVSMGRNGRARAKEVFAPRSHIDTIESIYECARTRIREAAP
jgi:glycosyltransferase involved in cell wall biosynthesis